MSTQPIRFFHRGKVVTVTAARTTRTVLDWLREDAACTGTKEGCNEGDCGACTVVIGELEPATAAGDGTQRRLSLRPVNACIQFLPTLNGKALFTVEDLKPIAGGGLHPVQQALVDCHASQCGFCTPGFVMSLWNTYEQAYAGTDRHHPRLPSRQRLADELSGNLCRCTGYRPILDAGQRMFDLPATLLDREPVAAALAPLLSAEPFCYVPGAQPPDQDGRSDSYHAPQTIEQLARLCQERPGARLLAGGTDVGLWVNKQFRQLGEIIHVGNVSALRQIEIRDGSLCIGAGASLESAWSALAGSFEGLTEVWMRFASPPIRHAGTMGGNLANGSPIGDAAPVLMALDTSLELRKGGSVRTIALDRFYVDYMRNQLAPGEFLQRIVVPLWPAAGMRDAGDAGDAGDDVGSNADLVRHLRVFKISKRFDSDISAVCAALAVHLDHDRAGNPVVSAVRLAYGGMAAVVKRAAKAEAALSGRRWDRAAIGEAMAALSQDFAPLSDMRAGSAYRMQIAQNLLLRFWLQTREVNALSSQATSVWSVMPREAAQAAQTAQAAQAAQAAGQQ